MQNEPKLAAPGAGLPLPELLVARILFWLRRRLVTRDSFDVLFHQERERIRALLGACDAETGARRVLIRRPRGLEDSSRNWSVWMTLEHLRLVNHGFARTLEALARGVLPPGTVSTAAVKPSPEATAAVVVAYEESCDALLAVATAIPDLRTPARHAHPWFGPLDAAGWHALAGVHMGLHRVQIERILGSLRATKG